MRRRRPYDPLEVVVIDLEVETATLVAIHQASREALALRTECKTCHILDIGQTLDRRPGGEVVLEAAHGRHRQLHAEHRRDFAGPGAGGVDEGIGRNTLSTREHDGLNLPLLHPGSPAPTPDINP